MISIAPLVDTHLQHVLSVCLHDRNLLGSLHTRYCRHHNELKEPTVTLTTASRQSEGLNVRLILTQAPYYLKIPSFS